MKKKITVVLSTFMVLSGLFLVLTSQFEITAHAGEFWGPAVSEWRENVAYSSTGHKITDEWAYDTTTSEREIFVKLDSSGKVTERSETWPGESNPEVIEGSTGFVQPVFVLDPEHTQFDKLVGKVLEVKYWDSFGEVREVQFKLLPGKNLGEEVELPVGNHDVEAFVLGQTTSDRVEVSFEEFIVVKDNEVQEEVYTVGLSQSVIDEIEDELEIDKEDEIVEDVKEKENKKGMRLIVVIPIVALLAGGGFVIFNKIKEMRED